MTIKSYCESLISVSAHSLESFSFRVSWIHNILLFPFHVKERDKEKEILAPVDTRERFDPRASARSGAGQSTNAFARSILIGEIKIYINHTTVYTARRNTRRWFQQLKICSNYHQLNNLNRCSTCCRAQKKGCRRQNDTTRTHYALEEKGKQKRGGKKNRRTWLHTS